jgi:hypothetical protein
MDNIIMGNIDGGVEKLAFESRDIERIIPRYIANLVYNAEGPYLLLELNGRMYPVQESINKDSIRPYFIVLKSGIAFNSSDYQILFNVEELPNDIISGISITGQKHLCKIHRSGEDKKQGGKEIMLSFKESGEPIELSSGDTEQLREFIQKIKKNEFFELLTMDLSEKLKGVARELIDFRKDIQSKIEPDIVEIASRDIPEASNQLEGINETLEESTMKIMGADRDRKREFEGSGIISEK